ncbi:hypothetical protein JXB37_04445 [candidate division WOR-3 bacterium]|nr:hypothetical protein [candidate division WOR-3 bacterium]
MSFTSWSWCLCVSILLLGGSARGGWFAELGLGTAFSLPSNLVIRQDGEEDIELVARYDTRPLHEVPYYDLRVGKADRRGAWELELVHHKLYLANRPGEVELFEITHGYNLMTANRALALGDVVLRLGAGTVMTHPESTIRGRVFDERQGILTTGWYFSGPCAQVGAGWQRPLSDRWRLNAELKLTGAWARVPVAGGTADVPNLALHLVAGAGYSF